MPRVGFLVWCLPYVDITSSLIAILGHINPCKELVTWMEEIVATQKEFEGYLLEYS